MIRRPPRSTLFPTRRSSDLSLPVLADATLAKLIRKGFAEVKRRRCGGALGLSCRRPTVATLTRSEEHTSELQSHLNLVCRLLLEKKNHTFTTTTVSRALALP